MRACRGARDYNSQRPLGCGKMARRQWHGKTGQEFWGQGWATHANWAFQIISWGATMLVEGRWVLLLWPQRPYCHLLSSTAKRLHPPVERRVRVGEVSCSWSPPRLMLAAKLTVHSVSYQLHALIDSVAEQNFIDASVAYSLQFTALSGQRLPEITHITEPISLTLSGNHSETSPGCTTPNQPIIQSFTARTRKHGRKH